VRRRADQMSGLFDWLWGKPQPSAQPQPGGALPPIDVDLYEVLRVAPNASQDEIRAAFRELAGKFHPDVNPDDPLAERRFREITTAYGILSNDAQRAAYDRMRGVAAPSALPRGLILPPPAPIIPEKETPRKVPPENIWEQIIGKPKPGKESVQDLIDVFAGPKRPPKIPSAEDIHSWVRTVRVPLSPGVESPTRDELFQIISHWPLDGVWDVVRADRNTNTFHKAGAMAVDIIAGSEQQPAEWELSNMFNIPLRQADEFIRNRGRQAFFSEILYPIFNEVTAILGQLKPVDIPGQFFLDWDPKGKQIELIYAENAGRRP
jgi:DnaJ-like protein